MKRIHNNLKKYPITKSKWFHRTTEKAWLAIREEGILWGGDTFHRTKGKSGYRYTYLSSVDWGKTYGDVLLEVDYQVSALSKVDNCRFEDENVDHKNEVGQFSVFIPIPVTRCRRIK